MKYEGIDILRTARKGDEACDVQLTLPMIRAYYRVISVYSSHFKGTGKLTYVFEVLYLERITSTEALIIKCAKPTSLPLPYPLKRNRKYTSPLLHALALFHILSTLHVPPKDILSISSQGSLIHDPYSFTIWPTTTKPPIAGAPKIKNHAITPSKKLFSWVSFYLLAQALHP